MGTSKAFRPNGFAAADLVLTAGGRRQAAAAARRIQASWTPVAVYTSPLGRCRATAEAIAEPFGLSPATLDGLIDIDYGKWQGLTPEEARAGWPDAADAWYHAAGNGPGEFYIEA